MKDMFAYHAPTEAQVPKYAAIREAEKTARGVFFGTAEVAMIGGSTPTEDYAVVNDACRHFHAAIIEHTPPSADRSAAERCVRIARMLMNEWITGDKDVLQMVKDAAHQLMLARMQACAAIALADDVPA